MTCQDDTDLWTCECGRLGSEHTERVQLAGGSWAYGMSGCSEFVPKICPHGAKWGDHSPTRAP